MGFICPARRAYTRLLLAVVIIVTAPPLYADVNIYSARKEHLIQPLLTQFTEKTGIQTHLLTAKADALLERIKSEGRDSPADLLITVDIARLFKAKQLGLFATVDSPVLTRHIPSQYRDSERQWFGLSVRARVIFVAKHRVPSPPTTYEDLALDAWKGRICIRSSNNVYNQSLVASLIYAHGEQKTLAWIKGFVRNFASNPSGGDRDQILLVASGACDIAIANTYYYGLMLHGKKEQQRKAAQQVQLIWPNQQGRGAHVNISGAGILRSAKNKREAIRLLEFLVSKEAQRLYSAKNYEYPVRSDLSMPDTLKPWGQFKSDALALDEIGKLNPLAVRLMDRGGWR